MSPSPEPVIAPPPDTAAFALRAALAPRTAHAARARRMRLVHRTSLVAPVLGALAGAWLLSRRQQRPLGFGVLGAALGLGLVRWQLQRLVTEDAPYELERVLGALELRRYPPQIWAETTVRGATWSEALHEGFHRLSGYLSGENEQSAGIGDSGPLSGPPGPSEKLSMTAPVLATVAEPGQLVDHTVSFVMPADRELGDLPLPRDARVLLRPLRARRVAALRFRGSYETDLPARQGEELLEQLRKVGLRPRSTVRFAAYDPPFTLAALRRNEVLVEIDE